MADRYVKQFEFENEVFSPNCPIALEKGAVLLDTKTNSYMLQLKFANIGTEGVSAVEIGAECTDSENHLAYPEITARYEEYTMPGENFGTKTLLPLPNNCATSFWIYVDKVTTDDDELKFSETSDYSTAYAGINVAELREQAEYELYRRNQVAQFGEDGVKWSEAVESGKVNMKWLGALLILNTLILIVSLGIFGLLPLVIALRGTERPTSVKWAKWLAIITGPLIALVRIPFVLPMSWQYGWWGIIIVVAITLLVILVIIAPYLFMRYHIRRQK